MNIRTRGVQANGKIPENGACASGILGLQSSEAGTTVVSWLHLQRSSVVFRSSPSGSQDSWKRVGSRARRFRSKAREIRQAQGNVKRDASGH